MRYQLPQPKALYATDSTFTLGLRQIQLVVRRYNIKPFE